MNTSAVLVFVLLGLALHQDFWLWNDATLIFGFLPAGLAYHAAYSLGTAGLWIWVVRRAWPRGLEGSEEPGERGGAQQR